MARILVVGAGPTGLTMAIALARFGVVPRLIERAATPPEDRSRAIVIQARTLELFEDLGVVHQVFEAGMVVDAAHLFTRRGRRGSIRIRPEWIDSAYGRFVTLPQEETERILNARCAELGVNVERGVELLGIEHARGGPVVARLRGPDGREAPMEADWIVGCDGAHSAVREQIGLSFPGETYRDECLLGDVDMRWSLPDGEVSICPGPDGVLLAFPLPGTHRFRVIMILPASAPPEARRLDADEFIAKLQRLTPRMPGGQAPAVLATRWLTRYRLHRRGVVAYRMGRCFVAGDAAHIHSPVGAQGMNTGIQDACNLGWKLALVARGDAPEALLASYDDERHRVGAHLLASTDRLFALLAGGGRVARFVRRLAPTLAVRALATSLFGKRLARFVSQTAIRYHGALSVEGAGARALPKHAPRAGTRAPDVRRASVQRLHPMLHGTRFTLLLFSASSQSLLLRFRELGARLSARFGEALEPMVWTLLASSSERDVQTDPNGAVHARYGAEHGALYLVRPDGYIAFRGGPADEAALRRTLEQALTPRVAQDEGAARAADLAASRPALS